MTKVKYGKVEIPADEFKDENVNVHVSIRLPMSLVKALKKLSLNETYQGKYQSLAKTILIDYVQFHEELDINSRNRKPPTPRVTPARRPPIRSKTANKSYVQNLVASASRTAGRAPLRATKKRA